VWRLSDVGPGDDAGLDRDVAEVEQAIPSLDKVDKTVVRRLKRSIR
jgi:hypothetical protein